MASGIKDKVAILGMGCSKFGERWDASPADLMVEAFEEGLADAGIDKTQIQMAWFGAGIDAFNVGSSAMPLSIALYRSLSWCGLCGRFRSLRHCAGTGCREAQGRGLRRPATAHSRC